MKEADSLAEIQAQQHELFQSFRNNSTDEVTAPKKNDSKYGTDMDIFLARLLDIRLNRDVKRKYYNTARDEKIAVQLAREINADAKPSNDLSKDEELARQLLREDQLEIDALRSQSGADTSEDEKLARMLDQNFRSSRPSTSGVRKDADFSRRLAVGVSNLLEDQEVDRSTEHQFNLRKGQHMSKDEQLARSLDQNCRRSTLPYTSRMHKDTEFARLLAKDETENLREAQGKRLSFSVSDEKRISTIVGMPDKMTDRYSMIKKSPNETARRSVVNLSKHDDQHFNQRLASSTEVTRHAKASQMKNNSNQKEMVRGLIEVKEEKLSHENLNSRVLEMMNRTARKSSMVARPPDETAGKSEDEIAIERLCQQMAQQSEEGFKARPPGETAGKSEENALEKLSQKTAQKSEEGFKDYLLSRRRKTSIPI
eukprot:CAMPEP_0194331290 /NCGR_PEP_ID=MMETSP0171-20130528/55078_1 /TAXON_ID=218684 /ORGANISM="Corethron pennatum, Strain L29A3" /LENGTH=425 /DNA_ID=CAMNT_0039092717 /DNA_START=56 /DNA_END=1330 /DNA_ORIENTATION=+